MSWIEIISLVILLIDVFFKLLADMELLRMPYLFFRKSAVTKASTLGAGFILLAAALYLYDLGNTSRSLATIIFVLLTAPVVPHRIGRVIYSDEIPIWEDTRRDDFSGHYNQTTHQLSGAPCDDFAQEENA